MFLIDYIQTHMTKGKVLITAHNPKNREYLTRYLKKHRFKALHVETFEEAKKLLDKRKVLGCAIDHTFTADHEHTGLDLVRFIRRDRAEELRGLPIFVVADVDTATLQEYEYLKINRYFDTTQERVGYVVDEMDPYFIERD